MTIRALFVLPALLILVGALFAQWTPGVAHLIHDLFEPLCHQDPARSPELFGHTIAVCWRCAGIHTGVAIAAISLNHKSFGSLQVWPLLIGIAFVDWVLGHLGLTADAGPERFVTGMSGGLGLAAASVIAFDRARTLSLRALRHVKR